MKRLIAVFILHYGLLSESSVPLTLSNGSGNYAGLCPYREFCTSKSVKNITDPASCCQKCSCSPTCYEVGSCCPDMPDVDNKKPKYACQDITAFQPKNPFARKGKTRISFRVVDDCPNKNISEKYSRCVNATHLEDFIFVSDPSDERIFRNYYCAECNGVTDVISWKLSIRECDDLFFRQFNSLAERNEYIVTHCSVLPLQPVPEFGAMSRCLEDESPPPESKYCQRSPTIDETIKHLCGKNIPSTNTLFKEITPGGEYLFPNIFCYFCSIRDTNIDAGCVQSTYVIPFKAPSVTFTGLISLGEMFPKNDEHLNIQACDHSSIWDPFAKRCRPFYCHLGTIPAGNRCMPLLHSESGVVFGLYFIIEIETAFLNRSKKISDIVDSFLQNMLQENGLYCNLCNRPFFRLKNTNNSNLFTDFMLYSSESCSSRGILAWGRFVLSKGSIGIKIEDEGDVFEVQLKLSAEPALGEGKREYIKYFFDNRCTDAVQLVDWMFLDCPFFRVSEQSLKNVELVNLELNDWNSTRAMKIYNASDVAVCVKDYFHFLSSDADDIKPQVNAQLLLLLTFCFSGLLDQAN